MMASTPAAPAAARPVTPYALWMLTVLAVVFNLSILLYFAATANMWDDEVNTFFLARLPASELLALMAENYDEDAPLFPLLEHYWIAIAGYSPFLLRLLPFGWWIICLAGIGVLAHHLGGNRGLPAALIVAALWPYHWINPISLRWYSMAAALLVWNLYFFSRFLAYLNGPLSASRRTGVLLGAMVAITCALLWYTVYAAPVLFVAHLALVVMEREISARALRGVLVCWLIAALLYLPWVNTFATQLGQSAGRYFSVWDLAGAVYSLLAGDFSTPDAVWISIPLALLFTAWSILTLRGWTHTRVPFVVACVTFFALALVGVLQSKRLLIISVPLSTAFGLALGCTLRDLPPATRRALAVAAVLLTLVGLGGTLGNIAARSGWSSYRWLDDVAGAVAAVRTEYPDAILLSNSNSVAFYGEDPLGLHLTGRLLQDGSVLAEQVKVWDAWLRDEEVYGPILAQHLQDRERLAYIHVAYFVEGGSADDLQAVLDWLRSQGYTQVGTWVATPIGEPRARYLDAVRAPPYRVTVVFMRQLPTLTSSP